MGFYLYEATAGSLAPSAGPYTYLVALLGHDVIIGENIEYTLTVTNMGNNSISAIHIYGMTIERPSQAPLL